MKKLFTVALLLAMPAFAALGDPWYHAYKVRGGDIVHYMGPYESRIECLGARFELPLGATSLGCFQ
jgi:hypothetical protein